jgi:hypothetical protein
LFSANTISIGDDGADRQIISLCESNGRTIPTVMTFTLTVTIFAAFGRWFRNVESLKWNDEEMVEICTVEKW